jgi:hypothetical protein
VLEAPHSLVLDADALHLLGPERLRELAHRPILTPHSGEFAQMFGASSASKVGQARSGRRARWRGHHLQGRRHGRGRAGWPRRHSPDRFALAGKRGHRRCAHGIVAALRAKGLEPFEAACAGVWLHGRAAGSGGAGADRGRLARLPPSRFGRMQ